MERNCKKILITGASGLIGRELCKHLSVNHDVVGVDNNFRFKDFIPDNCHYVKQDIVNYLETAENNFDYIFHMAAINGTSHFYNIPLKVLENNISTDLSVFNFAKKNPNTKIIYASSSEVVADANIFPTPEITDIVIKDIHNPRWSYRFSKIVSENFLFSSDLNFLIIRFFNVYGKNSTKGHFIGDIVDKIKSDTFELHGAHETRSFCYIDDAVDALLNIYDVANNEVINIGNNDEISIIDAANVIVECLGLHQKSWKTFPSKVGSVSRRIPDISKLKSYYPKYQPLDFKSGMTLILNNNE